MPIARGSGVLPAEPEAIKAAARAIGYPVLVKPAGGGGGIGMLPAKDETELIAKDRAMRQEWLEARGYRVISMRVEDVEADLASQLDRLEAGVLERR